MTCLIIPAVTHFTAKIYVTGAENIGQGHWSSLKCNSDKKISVVQYKD